MTNKELTLYQTFEKFDNNYIKEEDSFRAITTGELVTRTSLETTIRKVPSISIVTACYNQDNLLSNFLEALKCQSTVEKNPSLVQLILVDDGSSKRAVDIARHIKLPFDLIVVTQNNYREPYALNTGLSLAQGDIIFLTNPDTIPIPGTIFEHQVRHELLPLITTIGFRMHVMPEEMASLSNFEIGQMLEILPPTTTRDNKDGQFLRNYFSGNEKFTDSVLEKSDNLKKYRGWQIFAKRDLPACIEANSFCFRRDLLDLCGGFDENMVDWGFYDNYFGLKLLSFCIHNQVDIKVIPVLTSIGYHPWHGPRAYSNFEDKIQGSRKNQQLYERLKQTPLSKVFGPSIQQIKENRQFKLVETKPLFRHYICQ